MSPKEHIVLDVKVSEITQNDVFFTLQAVGKDEVSSSNLPSSSKSIGFLERHFVKGDLIKSEKK